MDAGRSLVDLIEDWIEMRSKLQRQLEVLEAGEIGQGQPMVRVKGRK
jgi:hypothetical protein